MFNAQYYRSQVVIITNSWLVYNLIEGKILDSLTYLTLIKWVTIVWEVQTLFVINLILLLPYYTFVNTVHGRNRDRSKTTSSGHNPINGESPE